jgi:CMP/dCMP kinase
MRAVTISREYGSGGGEIAARLARRLSWHLIDHQIVVEISRMLGETLEETKARDEHAPGMVALLADSLRWAAPLPGWMPNRTTDEEMRRYRTALEQVVGVAVERGQVVIVGRGAQTLLADRRDVLHVRIVAPLEQRAAYVAVRESLDAVAARERIQRKDADRAHYLQSVEHRAPSDPLLYDLTINTGVLSLDAAVDLVALALEKKAQREDVLDDDLGPGAGLTAYPAPPPA